MSWQYEFDAMMINKLMQEALEAALNLGMNEASPSNADGNTWSPFEPWYLWEDHFIKGFGKDETFVSIEFRNFAIIKTATREFHAPILNADGELVKLK